MTPDPRLHRFARDIQTGESITDSEGIELARHLEKFLLDSDPTLQRVDVHFINKLGEPPKALRIHLYKIIDV
jgi:hypothetical protein